MNTRATPGDYRLVVAGELGDRFASHFDGMELTREGGTTVLTGRLEDQAQLMGVVQKAHELGLELVSLERLDVGAGVTAIPLDRLLRGSGAETSL